MRKKVFLVFISLFVICACTEMPENGSVFTEVPGTTVKESSLSKKTHKLSEYYGYAYQLTGLYNCSHSKNKTFYFKASDHTLYDNSYNILAHIEGLGSKTLQFEEDFVIVNSSICVPNGNYTTELAYTYTPPTIETERGIYPLLESNKARLLYIDSDYMILECDETVDKLSTIDFDEACFSRLVFECVSP
jgi:hypothetical protein